MDNTHNKDCKADSLQQVIEEYENSEGHLKDDTEEGLEDFRNFLMYRRFSLREEDFSYMLGIIERLDPDPKNKLNSYFAKIVVREYVLSSVSFSLKNEFRGLMDYCDCCNISVDDIIETADEMIEKHGDAPFGIQMSVIRLYAMNIKDALDSLTKKDAYKSSPKKMEEACHYINASLTNVVNGTFISALNERMEEMRKAREERYREAA